MSHYFLTEVKDYFYDMDYNFYHKTPGDREGEFVSSENNKGGVQKTDRRVGLHYQETQKQCMARAGETTTTFTRARVGKLVRQCTFQLTGN